jgi:pyridoxal phosphate enzyme (YggS family)
MTMIADKLQSVRQRLAAACSACGREPAEVSLLAVSKTFGPEAVRAAFEAGQRAFGENYVQEALDKMAALRDLPLEWHCIGPLQSNKTRPVAEQFNWVHSVDRLKIAQRLSEQRPPGLPELNVCIQLNVDGGINKSGVTPAEALALARAVTVLPRLRLRGVMSIPEPSPDLAAQLAVHRRTRALFDEWRAALGSAAPQFDTLSMGMSADLEAAVQAGSTMVRVGTAIFGGRAAAT